MHYITFMDQFFKSITKSQLRVFLFLFVLAVIGYFSSLNIPFKTMDDYMSIVSNPLIKDVRHLPEIFTSSVFGVNAYWRPAVSLSFMLEYHLFGLNAVFYYINNLLIHVLCGFFAYRIIAAISKEKGVAFLTSVLFVIHPIHSEAIANVPGRSNSFVRLVFTLGI